MTSIKINKKWWLLLIVIGVGITIMTQPFQRVEASTKPGTFDIVGYNNAPTFNRFIGPDSNGARLTPNTNISIALDVEDLDTISDIKSLTFVFYYTQNEPSDLSSLDTDFDALSTTSENGTEVLMRWENNGAAANGSTEAAADDPDVSFSIVSSSGIGSSLSWQVISSTVPTTLSDFEGTTFNFELEFKISKVAKEALNSNWRFGVIVEDARTILNFDSAQLNTGLTKISTLQSDFSPVATDVSISESDRYNMDFYGEINPPQNASLSWPNVLSPGTLFDSEEHVSLSGIQFISNSDYLISAKSDSFWQATGSAVTTGGIIEVTKGTSNEYSGADLTDALLSAADEQKFRLGIDTTSSYNQSTLVLLDATNTFIEIDEDLATTEAGSSKTYYFFIEIANLFYNADYTGTITIGISNKPSS